MKLNRLPRSVQADIRDWYRENRADPLTDAQIEALPAEELLDAYLKWNGIIGYTEQILAIMRGTEEATRCSSR